MSNKSISTVLIAGVLAAGALLPAAAVASVPTKADVKAASAACRAERGTTPESKSAFKEKYGTNAKRTNAFGKCVSAGARERASDRSKATRGCVTERGRTKAKREAFNLKYGGKDSLKRCVAAQLAPVAAPS